MNKNNITYEDNTGNKVTTDRKYTKFPYDLNQVAFLEKGHDMLNVRNPFSGEVYMLSPVEESVYSMIMGAQMMPGYMTSPKLQNIVRQGLDWVRDNHAKAYMALLD
jgi:hypothetical protein